MLDSNVKSLTYPSATRQSTIGVIEAEPTNLVPQTMNIIEGEMLVKLTEPSEWVTYKACAKYTIDANQKFQVKVSVQTSYL